MEPTTDLRSIKRAYAKRLKANRPDDDSRAFRELHDAYKFACRLAENDSEDVDADPVEEWVNVSNLVDLQVAIPDTSAGIVRDEAGPQPGSVEVHEEIDEKEFDNLLAYIDRTLGVEVRHSDLSDWKGLEGDKRWLEEEFRREAGLRVLRKIVDHQKLCRDGASAGQELNEDELIYLDSICGWRDRFFDLLNLFDEEDIEFIFGLPAHFESPAPQKGGLKGGATIHYKFDAARKHVTSMTNVWPTVRFFGFSIDMAILSVPYFAIKLSLVGPATPMDAIYLGSVFLFLAPFFESSTWHATPGKRLLDLVVVTSDYTKISPSHALFRSLGLVFAIWALLTINRALGEPFSSHNAIIWPFILTFWFAGGRYPQDVLSRTRLVKRNYE